MTVKEVEKKNLLGALLAWASFLYDITNYMKTMYFGIIPLKRIYYNVVTLYVCLASTINIIPLAKPGRLASNAYIYPIGGL